MHAGNGVFLAEERTKKVRGQEVIFRKYCRLHGGTSVDVRFEHDIGDRNYRDDPLDRDFAQYIADVISGLSRGVWTAEGEYG